MIIFLKMPKIYHYILISDFLFYFFFVDAMYDIYIYIYFYFYFYFYYFFLLWSPSFIVLITTQVYFTHTPILPSFPLM